MLAHGFAIGMLRGLVRFRRSRRDGRTAVQPCGLAHRHRRRWADRCHPTVDHCRPLRRKHSAEDPDPGEVVGSGSTPRQATARKTEKMRFRGVFSQYFIVLHWNCSSTSLCPKGKRLDCVSGGHGRSRSSTATVGAVSKPRWAAPHGARRAILPMDCRGKNRGAGAIACPAI
jgi:hypothetical protein